MKIFYLFILLIVGYVYADSTNVFENWNSLDKKIALNNIEKEKAIRLIREYEKRVIDYFYSNNGKT